MELEVEMAILETEVEVGIGGRTVDYWEKLKYHIPRVNTKWGLYSIPKGTKIIVKVDDLPDSSHVKVTKICDECGVHIKNRSYDSIIRYRKLGDGLDRCFNCGQFKSGENKKENFPYNKSLEYVAIEKGMLYLLDEYSANNLKTAKEVRYGSDNNVLWLCPNCNKEYNCPTRDRLSRDRGCLRCSESKGEKIIEEFLSCNSLIYLPQYRFKDCKNKLPLPFDFVIFNENKQLLCAIEFDGKQHFSPVNFGGMSKEQARESFALTQKKDAIKTNYCFANNISLIRIPYWDFGHIEEILTTELIKLKLNIAM